jgi:hypothetical protein
MVNFVGRTNLIMIRTGLFFADACPNIAEKRPGAMWHEMATRCGVRCSRLFRQMQNGHVNNELPDHRQDPVALDCAV